MIATAKEVNIKKKLTDTTISYRNRIDFVLFGQCLY